MQARYLVFFFLMATMCLSGIAQRTPPNQADIARRAREAQAQQQAESDELLYEQQQMLKRKDLGKVRGVNDDAPPPPLDKETIDRVKKFRKVDPELAAKYAAFLAGAHTGITRLFIDNGCFQTGVVRVDDKCKDFIPESYSYSFRTNGYIDGHYSDLAFRGRAIVAGSFFAQGALTALGDTPIENVDLTTAGVKELAEMRIDKDLSGARKTAQHLKEGIKINGLAFASTASPVLNATYAVRVIAYKNGTFIQPPSPRSTPMERRFLSLDYDTRGDVIVVFRIVGLEDDGAVTILWKRLDLKDAPKIKFATDEPLADFHQ
jgi:hypothetical protein